MSLPGEFAMKHALGLSSPANFGSAHFRQIVRLVLSAESRYELFETGVAKGKYRTVFNSNIIDEQHEGGLASHRDWLKEIMTQQYVFPPPERWGAGFARSLEVEIDAEQSVRLAEGISAHYCYQKSNFEKANVNPKLNIKKREGDWVDGQQLIYLSDPNVRFVTADKFIKEWASPVHSVTEYSICRSSQRTWASDGKIWPSRTSKRNPMKCTTRRSTLTSDGFGTAGSMSASAAMKSEEM